MCFTANHSSLDPSPYIALPHKRYDISREHFPRLWRMGRPLEEVQRYPIGYFHLDIAEVGRPRAGSNSRRLLSEFKLYSLASRIAQLYMEIAVDASCTGSAAESTDGTTELAMGGMRTIKDSLWRESELTLPTSVDMVP